MSSKLCYCYRMETIIETAPSIDEPGGGPLAAPSTDEPGGGPLAASIHSLHTQEDVSVDRVNVTCVR